jgi:uncharacterized membrane protein
VFIFQSSALYAILNFAVAILHWTSKPLNNSNMMTMLLFKLDMLTIECYLIMLEFYYIHDRCLLGE